MIAVQNENKPEKYYLHHFVAKDLFLKLKEEFKRFSYTRNFARNSTNTNFPYFLYICT